MVFLLNPPHSHTLTYNDQPFTSEHGHPSGTSAATPATRRTTAHFLLTSLLISPQLCLLSELSSCRPVNTIHFNYCEHSQCRPPTGLPRSSTPAIPPHLFSYSDDRALTLSPLRTYVNDTFAKCTDLNRAAVEAELKKMIFDAFQGNKLWTTDWSKVELKRCVERAGYVTEPRTNSRASTVCLRRRSESEPS